MDGIDAVLVVCEADKIQLEHSHSHQYSATLKSELAALCKTGDNELHRLLIADRHCAQAFAEATHALLSSAKLNVADITAIGSHGQTIRHQAASQTVEKNSAYSLQIGDPNTIAALTGITTIADFRRKDIALGGQGAPLVPAFHRAIFAAKKNRAVINIGGIANITFLAADGTTLGFDCGPGNNLMDRWIERHQHQQYDADGRWASSGKSHAALLKKLLQHDYFLSEPPKSLDREDFNLAWLDSQINPEFSHIDAADIQATLADFTAASIAHGMMQLPVTVNEVFICGGGAFNKHLMRSLENYLHPAIVASTASLGVDPEWVEAMAFAWLAKQTLEKKTGNIASVTGASRDAILGGIYFP
jgi:anhydro-N-acetylmuramic acid kinase